MGNLSRVVGVALILLGTALFAWLAYDATVVMDTLRLAAVVSEGAVAAVGLGLAAVLLAVGVAVLRRAKRPRLGTA